MSAEILKATGIKYAYEKEKAVLKGVSFSLSEGEYVSILGHNGSGKSTLAKIIAGLIDNYEGELLLFGENAKGKRGEELRQNVAMVFQNPDNQFVGSSVEDDVAFGLENRAIPASTMRNLVKTALENVGMEEYANKAPENLSGGQKQRVALAGVIALSPKLLILDEATSMVDPKGRRDIYRALKKMREGQEGLAILSITHDVEEAVFADRLIVLNDGEIVATGTPKEIFSDKEILDKYRLRPPFRYRLENALEEEGMTLPSGELSIAQIAEALWKK